MKNKKILTAVIAAVAALGIALMVLGSIPGKEESAESAELEEKFEKAILMMDGVEEANVIITKSGDEITGAAAVCKGGGAAIEERVTKLLCSGLNLSASKIYVICN